MKKLLSLLLAVAMILGLCACGAKQIPPRHLPLPLPRKKLLKPPMKQLLTPSLFWPPLL